MKKKIIIGLSIFTLFFIVGGIFIIVSVETLTSRLDEIITLHQVEILREHLLIQTKKIQADINLKNTRYARSFDSIVSHAKGLGEVTKKCFECHHSEKVVKRLDNIKFQVDEYRNALSRVLTIRANTARLDEEADNAFIIGERLLKEVNDIIITTSAYLELRTKEAFEMVAVTKSLLYFLIALGPISAAILAVILVKGFSKPINALLQAAKRLEKGDLDYRVERLKDEFGEVALSFNEMAASLKEQI